MPPSGPSKNAEAAGRGTAADFAERDVVAKEEEGEGEEEGEKEEEEKEEMEVKEKEEVEGEDEEEEEACEGEQGKLSQQDREYWQKQLPAGFQILMEKIARVVMRNQPPDVFEFIARYTEEQLVKRNAELWSLPPEPYLAKLFTSRTGQRPSWNPCRRNLPTLKLSAGIFPPLKDLEPDLVATEYIPLPDETASEKTSCSQFLANRGIQKLSLNGTLCHGLWTTRDHSDNTNLEPTTLSFGVANGTIEGVSETDGYLPEDAESGDSQAAAACHDTVAQDAEGYLTPLSREEALDVSGGDDHDRASRMSSGNVYFDPIADHDSDSLGDGESSESTVSNQDKAQGRRSVFRVSRVNEIAGQRGAVESRGFNARERCLEVDRRSDVPEPPRFKNADSESQVSGQLTSSCNKWKRALKDLLHLSPDEACVRDEGDDSSGTGVDNVSRADGRSNGSSIDTGESARNATPQSHAPSKGKGIEQAEQESSRDGNLVNRDEKGVCNGGEWMSPWHAGIADAADVQEDALIESPVCNAVLTDTAIRTGSSVDDCRFDDCFSSGSDIQTNLVVQRENGPSSQVGTLRSWLNDVTGTKRAAAVAAAAVDSAPSSPSDAFSGAGGSETNTSGLHDNSGRTKGKGENAEILAAGTGMAEAVDSELNLKGDSNKEEIDVRDSGSLRQDLEPLVQNHGAEVFKQDKGEESRLKPDSTSQGFLNTSQKVSKGRSGPKQLESESHSPALGYVNNQRRQAVFEKDEQPGMKTSHQYDTSQHSKKERAGRDFVHKFEQEDYGNDSTYSDVDTVTTEILAPDVKNAGSVANSHTDRDLKQKKNKNYGAENLESSKKHATFAGDNKTDVIQESAKLTAELDCRKCVDGDDSPGDPGTGIPSTPAGSLHGTNEIEITMSLLKDLTSKLDNVSNVIEDILVSRDKHTQADESLHESIHESSSMEAKLGVEKKVPQTGRVTSVMLKASALDNVLNEISKTLFRNDMSDGKGENLFKCSLMRQNTRTVLEFTEVNSLLTLNVEVGGVDATSKIEQEKRNSVQGTHINIKRESAPEQPSLSPGLEVASGGKNSKQNSFYLMNSMMKDVVIPATHSDTNNNGLDQSRSRLILNHFPFNNHEEKLDVRENTILKGTTYQIGDKGTDLKKETSGRRISVINVTPTQNSLSERPMKHSKGRIVSTISSHEDVKNSASKQETYIKVSKADGGKSAGRKAVQTTDHTNWRSTVKARNKNSLTKSPPCYAKRHPDLDISQSLERIDEVVQAFGSEAGSTQGHSVDDRFEHNPTEHARVNSSNEHEDDYAAERGSIRADRSEESKPPKDWRLGHVPEVQNFPLRLMACAGGTNDDVHVPESMRKITIEAPAENTLVQTFVNQTNLSPTRNEFELSSRQLRWYPDEKWGFVDADPEDIPPRKLILEHDRDADQREASSRRVMSYSIQSHEIRTACDLLREDVDGNIKLRGNQIVIGGPEPLAVAGIGARWRLRRSADGDSGAGARRVIGHDKLICSESRHPCALNETSFCPKGRFVSLQERGYNSNDNMNTSENDYDHRAMVMNVARIKSFYDTDLIQKKECVSCIAESEKSIPCNNKNIGENDCVTMKAFQRRSHDRDTLQRQYCRAGSTAANSNRDLNHNEIFTADPLALSKELGSGYGSNVNDNNDNNNSNSENNNSNNSNNHTNNTNKKNSSSSNNNNNNNNRSNNKNAEDFEGAIESEDATLQEVEQIMSEAGFSGMRPGADGSKGEPRAVFHDYSGFLRADDISYEGDKGTSKGDNSTQVVATDIGVGDVAQTGDSLRFRSTAGLPKLSPTHPKYVRANSSPYLRNCESVRDDIDVGVVGRNDRGTQASPDSVCCFGEAQTGSSLYEDGPTCKLDYKLRKAKYAKGDPYEECEQCPGDKAMKATQPDDAREKQSQVAATDIDVHECLQTLPLDADNTPSRGVLPNPVHGDKGGEMIRSRDSPKMDDFGNEGNKKGMEIQTNPFDICATGTTQTGPSGQDDPAPRTNLPFRTASWENYDPETETISAISFGQQSFDCQVDSQLIDGCHQAQMANNCVARETSSERNSNVVAESKAIAGERRQADDSNGDGPPISIEDDTTIKVKASAGTQVTAHDVNVEGRTQTGNSLLLSAPFISQPLMTIDGRSLATDASTKSDGTWLDPSQVTVDKMQPSNAQEDFDADPPERPEQLSDHEIVDSNNQWNCNYFYPDEPVSEEMKMVTRPDYGKLGKRLDFSHVGCTDLQLKGRSRPSCDYYNQGSRFLDRFQGDPVFLRSPHGRWSGLANDSQYDVKPSAKSPWRSEPDTTFHRVGSTEINEESLHYNYDSEFKFPRSSDILMKRAEVENARASIPDYNTTVRNSREIEKETMRTPLSRFSTDEEKVPYGADTRCGSPHRSNESCAERWQERFPTNIPRSAGQRQILDYFGKSSGYYSDERQPNYVSSRLQSDPRGKFPLRDIGLYMQSRQTCEKEANTCLTDKGSTRRPVSQFEALTHEQIARTLERGDGKTPSKTYLDSANAAKNSISRRWDSKLVVDKGVQYEWLLDVSLGFANSDGVGQRFSKIPHVAGQSDYQSSRANAMRAEIRKDVEESEKELKGNRQSNARTVFDDKHSRQSTVCSKSPFRGPLMATQFDSIPEEEDKENNSGVSLHYFPAADEPFEDYASQNFQKKKGSIAQKGSTPLYKHLPLHELKRPMRRDAGDKTTPGGCAGTPNPPICGKLKQAMKTNLKQQTHYLNAKNNASAKDPENKACLVKGPSKNVDGKKKKAQSAPHQNDATSYGVSTRTGRILQRTPAGAGPTTIGTVPRTSANARRATGGILQRTSAKKRAAKKSPTPATRGGNIALSKRINHLYDQKTGIGENSDVNASRHVPYKRKRFSNRGPSIAIQT